MRYLLFCCFVMMNFTCFSLNIRDEISTNINEDAKAYDDCKGENEISLEECITHSKANDENGNSDYIIKAYLELLNKFITFEKM